LIEPLIAALCYLELVLGRTGKPRSPVLAFGSKEYYKPKQCGLILIYKKSHITYGSKKNKAYIMFSNVYRKHLSKLLAYK